MSPRVRAALLLAALPVWVGCAEWAVHPAAPAASARFDYPQQEPGERYYCLVFSAESTPKLMRFTHTWATVVRVAEREDGGPPLIDAQTISWLPAAIDIHPLDLTV